MAVFRVIGGQLISEMEFASKGPEIVREMSNRTGGGAAGPGIMLDDDRPFSFSPAPAPAGAPQATAFTPVGFGTPITIDIRHVWSGRVGSKDGPFGLGGKGDIAVVSGVKDWGAFKASARGLNWVARNVGKHAALGRPGALQDGTRIIAYQKAVATRQLTVTVELSSGPSDDNAASQLSRLFSSAAGIPILLPYAGTLLAAGAILPAFSKLLNTISGGNSLWSQSEDLNFGIAGTQAADAGYRVIAAAAAPFQGMHFQEGTGLVGPDGRAYDGDEPYVVIAIDGAPQAELEAFTPAVVSAELARRFHMAQDGGGVVDDLLELTSIVSDVKFRDEALKVRKQMEGVSGTERDTLSKRFDALVRNIQSPELRPG